MLQLVIEKKATLDTLRAEATSADIAFIESNALTSSRQIEILAWRNIVRRQMGYSCRIEYRQNGAPYIVDSDKHISVSHSAGYVAVLFSDRPCGVDIELRTRNFGRAQRRFISEAEAKIASTNFDLGLVWCAKEAAYKLCGVEGLDLLHDMIVEKIDYEASQIDLRVTSGDLLRIKTIVTEEYIVAYI